MNLPSWGKAPGISAILVCCFLLSVTMACEEAKKVIDFIDSISDGAPCTENAGCLGGYCLTEDKGYPNGYCTTLKCEEAGCSGFYAECFRFDVDGNSTTACLEQCNLDGTCDRADEGYTCVTYNDTPVCLPPGVTNAPAQGAIGSACSANPQCNGTGEGGEGTCLQTFFGGYCSVLGCASASDCPDNNACVPLNPDGMTDQDKAFACMDSCEADKDCRFGYSCQPYQGANICLEKGDEDTRTRNPDGVDDGKPCLSNINCKGGTCIREVEGAEGGKSYPGGYCTTRDCEDDTTCNGEAICISLNRTTTCRATCNADSDCRDGYACKPSEDGRKYCDTIAEPAVTPEQQMAGQIEVKCGSSKTLTFEVPQGARGFFIAPFTKSNARIEPRVLTKPDNSTVNIPNDYAFLNINQAILGNMSPLLFPASDSSTFKDAFGGGQYSLTVNTSASEVCYYVVPQMTAGTTLNVNLYFVGVPGVTANSAKNDKDVQAMVNVVKSIYSKMGITARVSNYYAASDSVTKNYQIVRDLYDVFNLVATSTSPGNSLDDQLSVNVFLIQDFNISDAPGLLGVSTGIPGMAGMHGTSGSGLVFSTANLGSDNQTLGQTMAHEIGHFLGLRHTTEHGGSDKDPISDTPSCLIPDLGFACPDAENFMFPFSLGGDRQTRTSNGQAFVLRSNPLVQ